MLPFFFFELHLSLFFLTGTRLVAQQIPRNALPAAPGSSSGGGSGGRKEWRRESTCWNRATASTSSFNACDTNDAPFGAWDCAVCP
jgi:hypothetical protein